MPVTSKELGSRLRTARDACRMTQDESAQHLGVSRSSVAQMELGNRAVSSLELDRLAYLYGRDIREFVADSFQEHDVLAALFRAQPQVLQQQPVIAKLRECMALGRELTNLELLVGIDRDASTTATYPLPSPKSRWDAIRQGEQVAEAERRRLGLGFAPAPDLVELLETQAIRTALVDLPDDISGLTLSDTRVGLFVVANRLHHLWRRRFSFTHEYAHVLLDRDRFGLVSLMSDRDDLIEIRANSFAAGFLMPEAGVRHFLAILGKGKPSRMSAEIFDEGDSVSIEGRTLPGTQDLQLYDAAQLAYHFGVSRQTALYRLRNLRYITAAELERLKSEDIERGQEVARLLDLPEPDHQQQRNEFRHRFLGLALEAFRRTALSRGKLQELARMAELAPRDLAKLLDDTGLSNLTSNDPDVLLPAP